MVQQKTFWHLLSQQRMPNEYEIVTSKLLLNTGEGFTGKRFELDVPLRQWYEQYQQGSPLACSSWEKFRDPRETTYTKYTELQMEKEIFVDCILEEIEASSYDRGLLADWVQTLATLVAPFRYPGHALMMSAAYVAQMAPGGRIVVAATFQAGDEARRVERLAYRIRQLQLAFPGFAADSKALWEQDQRWQPLRQFVERLLVTYDWGEAFVALNLILKPMIDELLLKCTSELALSHNDHLLGQIFYSLNEDSLWHRQWSQALTRTAIEDTPANRQLIQTWINKWYPGALRAVDAFSPLFEGKPGHPGVSAFRNLTSRIDACSTEYLRSMGLEPPLFARGVIWQVPEADWAGD
jgi:toluene monooxygenase system protein E